MKITLDTVRQVLKEALGFDSFVAGFITEVSEDPSLTTAGINANGQLVYNPKFVDKYVNCQEDLFSLIFHELLHPMFGHFIYSNGDLENIAADAIINAIISTIYSENSAGGNFFSKLYSTKGLQGILRPNSGLYHSKYYRLYQKLYDRGQCEDAISTGELIQTLKILTQGEKLSTIILLGSHGPGMHSEDNNGFSKEIISRIAEDIKKSLADKGGRYAGYSQNLLDLFVQALKTHLSIKKVLLQKFLTKRKIDKFREYHNVKRSGISPIPLYPSKRDLVLLATGFYPGYFHNQINRPKLEKKGLAIYLDVSGSVNNYLPKIIGIISNLRNDINSLFLFSNAVVETKFEDLLKGRIRATGGTDFNCIARSILENKFDKTVIITDGYASMSEEMTQKLKGIKLITLTILFGGATGCEDFAQFGEVILLDDACQ